jgi:DNA-binding NtrC family response regulator
VVRDERPDLTRLNLIGQSPAFVAAMRLIVRLAGCQVVVLLRGETGTGKELAARAIHYLGSRCDMPFIPVNCGAIPDMLVESELFGHARGAFTDARESQVGLVEQAADGTLFLDEVDTLSMKAQTALLRFLQDGSFRQLGGKGFKRSAARIVAATNADLEDLVRRGSFRSDLYFRLSIMPVFLPPLRERAGDIQPLVEGILRNLADQHGLVPCRADAAALRQLERYHWPGNVRELANVLLRAVLLQDGQSGSIGPELLSLPTLPAADDGRAELSFQHARAQAMADFEAHFVRRALAASAGNVSLAARRVGKERRSFGRLVKKYGIDRADFDLAA